jgi:hypothetical protein
VLAQHGVGRDVALVVDGDAGRHIYQTSEP